jgi:hypothetical protein
VRKPKSRTSWRAEGGAFSSEARATEEALRGQGKVQLVEEMDSDGMLGLGGHLKRKNDRKEGK